MRKLFAFLFLFSSVAMAQFTTVTGTVVDPTGLPYANGTITPSLVCSSTPYLGGLPYNAPSQPVGLDAKGSFSMQLGDVTQIKPTGCTWSFHTCSGAGTIQPGSPITGGPTCFDVTGVSISGPAQDISATLSAAAPRLGTGGTGGGATVASPGTAGQFLTYTSPNTVAGTPTLTTNGTTITSTAPILCPANSNCYSVSGTPTVGFGFGNFGSGQMPAVYGVGGLAGQVLALKVNGANVVTFPSIPAANFNAASPVAPTNGLNVTWQQAVGNPTTISAALVGDGVQSDCYLGIGVFGSCVNSSSTTTVTGPGSCALGTDTAMVIGVNPVCTFNLAALAKTYAFSCTVIFASTGAGSNQFNFNVNLSQAPTSRTYSFENTTYTGTNTFTISALGNNLDNGTGIPGAVVGNGGEFSGAINWPATAGTVKFGFQLGSGAGTTNAGSYCWLR